MVSRRRRRRQVRLVLIIAVIISASCVLWLSQSGGGSVVAQARHALRQVTGSQSSTAASASVGSADTDSKGSHHGRDEAGVALDPSAFAAGACEAFPPTHGDRHKTVFLDAGHGGLDPGGTGTTESGASISEASINLAVELDTMARLRADGYRVVVSRTGDTTVMRLTSADITDRTLTLQAAHEDVVARTRCANMGRANVLVGIYMDAGSSSYNAGSVAVYDADRSFASANRRLAGLLQRNVLRALDAHGWQIPNDGVHDDSTYGSVSGDAAEGGVAAEAAAYDHLMLLGPAQSGYFTTPSKMPGAVIEPLYLTDPFEGTIASTPGDQRVIAKAYATAIERYFR